MQIYKNAAWISEKIGDVEAAARYKELAQSDPKELPGYKDIYWKIYKREENLKHPGKYS